MRMVNSLQVQYMGIPAGSPSTNAVAVVYGGIAFSVNSTGDIHLDMYGIESGSCGRVLYFQEKSAVRSPSRYSFNSPSLGGGSSCAYVVGSDGNVVNNGWSVTNSYGHESLSGSYSYRLCVLGALEW